MKKAYEFQSKQQIQFFIVTTRAMALWTLKQMGDYVGVSGEAVRTWELGMATPAADKFGRIMALRADIVRAKKRGKRHEKSMRGASGDWAGVSAEIS